MKFCILHLIYYPNTPYDTTPRLGGQVGRQAVQGEGEALLGVCQLADRVKIKTNESNSTTNLCYVQKKDDK